MVSRAQASARRGGGLDEEQRLAAARRRRRRAGDDGRPVHGPRSIPAGLGAPSLSIAHVLGEPPSSTAASAIVRLRGAASRSGLGCAKRRRDRELVGGSAPSMMEGAVRASPAPAPPSHAWSICGRDEQSSAGSSSARPRRGRAPRESDVMPRRCTASRELVSRCGRGRRAVIARESSAPSSTRTARLLPRGRSAAQAPLQSRQPRVPSRTASAPAGCGTPCHERASSSARRRWPRRGRLALTIKRHGRLTQRSHCCDPCSPRRCAATGAKHPLQSMVLWTRVVEPRGKRHPHHDRDASSCERSRRAHRSPARARGPVRRRRAPATEASGGRRRITDANIDARGAGVGRRRRQVGATLVAADIGCVLPRA